MSNEIPATEQSIIKNMMLSKSHQDICSMVDCDIDDVASFIEQLVSNSDIVTWQMKLDEKNKQKKLDRSQKQVTRKPRKRANSNNDVKKLASELKDQKRANLAERMNIERQRAVSRRQPAYKTIERDFSSMILVRVDSHTHIYVNKGDDIEAAKKKYLRLVEKSKAAYLAQDVKPDRSKK